MKHVVITKVQVFVTIEVEAPSESEAIDVALERAAEIELRGDCVAVRNEGYPELWEYSASE